MSDKRLLCLYPWLQMGGADKFNLDMLAGLVARSWRATIVTTLPAEQAWRDAFAQYSDDIIDFAVYPPEEYPARLLHLLQSRAIDSVLISNSSTGYDLLPYLRAHAPHVAFVDYNHMEEPYWNAGGYPRLSLTYASALDLQIVSSGHLKSWMTERGGEDERIAVCTTNIDPHDWDPSRYDRQRLRAELHLRADAPVVLFAARLERQKQPLLLVDVMCRVVARHPDVHFLIAGDGLFAPYVRGFVRQHGLERRVHLLGAVTNQRIRELLAISDVFFLPSQLEGISLAVYEAMSMMVVPITADVGGQAELVTPECGVLVARGPHERDAYVNALLRLITEPDRLKQMGWAARERVSEHFRLSQMQQHMHELLIYAQELHQTHPRPLVEAHQALHAARHAIAEARHYQTQVYTQIGTDDTPRQRLRKLYWRLVERGLWQLVPAVERIREW